MLLQGTCQEGAFYLNFIDPSPVRFTRLKAQEQTSKTSALSAALPDWVELENDP